MLCIHSNCHRAACHTSCCPRYGQAAAVLPRITRTLQCIHVLLAEHPWEAQQLHAWLSYCSNNWRKLREPAILPQSQCVGRRGHPHPLSPHQPWELSAASSHTCSYANTEPETIYGQCWKAAGACKCYCCCQAPARQVFAGFLCLHVMTSEEIWLACVGQCAAASVHILLVPFQQAAVCSHLSRCNAACLQCAACTTVLQEQ